MTHISLLLLIHIYTQGLIKFISPFYGEKVSLIALNNSYFPPAILVTMILGTLSVAVLHHLTTAPAVHRTTATVMNRTTMLRTTMNRTTTAAVQQHQKRFPVISLSILFFFLPIAIHSLRHYSQQLGPLLGPLLSTIHLPISISALNFDAARHLSASHLLLFLAAEFLLFSPAAHSSLYASRLIPQIPIPIQSFLHSWPACSLLKLSNILLLLSSIKSIPSRKLIPLLLLALFSTHIYRDGFGINQAAYSSSSVFEFAPGYKVVARAESNTGFVAVVQSKSEYGDLLVMRCDHSILGGVYLDHGRDSIFRAFYLVDFVRFASTSYHADLLNSAITNMKSATTNMKSATTNHKSARATRSALQIKEEEEKDRNALQIGLGIGVSAKTLMESGVVVDIVELDPILYRYAREYFELPEPRNVYLMDARAFLDQQATTASTQSPSPPPTHKYDYILHDVFTGGLVPSSLFSLQAWTLISTLLKPKGVVAVNFVGSLDSASTMAVFATLKKVYGHVAVFKEMEEEGVDVVMNLVFFCAMESGGDVDGGIQFDFSVDQDRLPRSASYHLALDQFKLQKDMASVLEKMIMEKEDGNGDALVIRDEYNPLDALQDETAVDHFYLVNQVFSYPYFWTDLF